MELAETISTALLSQQDEIGILKLVWKISQTLYQAEEILQEMRGDIQERSIEIDVTGFGTTEFDLIEEKNKDRLEEIIRRGRKTAEDKLGEKQGSSQFVFSSKKDKQKEAPVEKREGNIIPKN